MQPECQQSDSSHCSRTSNWWQWKRKVSWRRWPQMYQYNSTGELIKSLEASLKEVRACPVITRDIPQECMTPKCSSPSLDEVLDKSLATARQSFGCAVVVQILSTPASANWEIMWSAWAWAWTGPLHTQNWTVWINPVQQTPVSAIKKNMEENCILL